jgi:hypothetical protein
LVIALVITLATAMVRGVVKFYFATAQADLAADAHQALASMTLRAAPPSVNAVPGYTRLPLLATEYDEKDGRIAATSAIGQSNRAFDRSRPDQFLSIGTRQQEIARVHGCRSHCLRGCAAQNSLRCHRGGPRAIRQ